MTASEISKLENEIKVKLLKKIEENIDKVNTNNDLYTLILMYCEIYST